MNFSASLPLAFVIGAAFGACLETAGLGQACKLAGMFTLREFTVLKVMFSAIVTALLGTFWLGLLGGIDLSALFVPETLLLPQIAGGLIFGAGFALSGLCPGTACVAAASGRIDGLSALAGIFGGVLFAGLVLPDLAQYNAGTWTLPAALDLPYGVVVSLIVLMAVALFALIEHWEKKR
jgi:uncharacterized membrane protein YedE/YeeE